MNKKIVVPMTAFALVLSAGGGLVAAAHADTASTSTTTGATTSAQIDSRPAFDFSKGGHKNQKGDAEVLLTGDDAAKASTAALSAVPGGVIQRVETDVDGGDTYEAHVTKSDGTLVTVHMDSSFVVTGTQTDGHKGPHGKHPQDLIPGQSNT